MNKPSRSWGTAVAVLLSLATIVFFVVGPLVQEAMDDSALDAHGVAGSAKIISYAGTGVFYNHNPVLAFQLEVAPSDGTAPFRTEKKLVVTPMEAPRLQPGLVRKVTFLPTDHDVLRFEQ